MAKPNFYDPVTASLTCNPLIRTPSGAFNTLSSLAVTLKVHQTLIAKINSRISWFSVMSGM